MFQAIRKWWNGLWEKEESPGPKISKEDIERVKETIEEIRSGSFDRAKPTGTDAQCIARAKAGQLRPFKREHIEPEKRVVEGRKIKLAMSSHVTIQRGIDGPVETEIINGEHRTITRGNITAHVDEKGDLLPLHDMDPPTRTNQPMIPMSIIAEPGIDCRHLATSLSDGIPPHFESLEETVAERLADPKPVRVELDELNADTPVPAQRKPRRRGKRGGVKRNRNKKK